MSAEFRLVEYDDFDLAAVVAIAKAIRPDDFTSVEYLRDWSANQRRAGRLAVRWLAYVDGEVVGFSYVGQSPWLDPAMMIVHVGVHPGHRQRGYGRDLLERAEATASENAATQVIGWADETQGGALHLLEQTGYREIDREWESTLRVQDIDEVSLRHAIDRVASSGIRLVPLSEVSGTRSGWRHDLYRLYAAVDGDVPTQFDLMEMPFEDFESIVLGRRLLPDGFLVAMDGDTLVGLTEPLLVDDDPTAIAQEMTGVRKRHRGRGIATALKASAALWAKENGYATIRTSNAQSNMPMLAVNDRLGFERDHATIEYLKDL
jgi:GNAT superfamily N-acetyltransferase